MNETKPSVSPPPYPDPQAGQEASAEITPHSPDSVSATEEPAVAAAEEAPEETPEKPKIGMYQSEAIEAAARSETDCDDSFPTFLSYIRPSFWD